MSALERPLVVMTRRGSPLGLRKAIIRTPLRPDGKVDWDAVPVGASIWVTVTDPSSPLHGRPILLTKRPDKQFVLTGGAGFRHMDEEDRARIEARRHSVVGAGTEIAPTKADVEAERRYKRELARQEPLREQRRALRKELREREVAARQAFLETVGVRQRHLDAQEREQLAVQAARMALDHGLDEDQARAFGKLVARHVDLAKRRVADAHAHAVARFLMQRFSQRRTQPEVRQEADQETDQSDRAAEGAPRSLGVDVSPPAELRVAPAVIELPDPRIVEGAASEAEMEHRIAQAIEAQTDRVLEHYREDLEEQMEAILQGEPPPAPQSLPEPPASRPDLIDLARDIQPVDVADPEGARRAIEAFRSYQETRQKLRQVEREITPLPVFELASPAALENLKEEVGGLSDEELARLLEHYEAAASRTADDALYQAISEHWNDVVGDRVHAYVVHGASSALTALVAEYLGDRFDIGRLVADMSVETAAWALAAYLYREYPDRFDEIKRRIEHWNAQNQRRTEQQALDRYRKLKEEQAEIERQRKTGELVHQATIDLLVTANLEAQREELGTAMGSLSASATLLRAMEGVERTAKSGGRDVLELYVGADRRLAEDRLRKLHLKEGRDALIVERNGGWAIQTSAAKLARFIRLSQKNQREFDRWEAIKTDVSNVELDEEGRAWAKDYKVPFFRDRYVDEITGQEKPFRFTMEQRNDIEWLSRAGGGLVTRVTGSGKTLTALGFVAKQLAQDPNHVALVLAPNGRVAQWASEAARFTTLPVLAIPENTTAEQRALVYREAVEKLEREGKPRGLVIITSHRDGASNSDLAIFEAIQPDTVVIDEPQELKSRRSAERSAALKRIMRLPAKHRIALTATPAREAPLEAYNLVNWTNPGQLGYRTHFVRAFTGFRGGTNAQDALLQRLLWREIAPFVSGDRLTAAHFRVNHHDVTVRRTAAQIERQKAIEAKAQAVIDEEIARVPPDMRVGAWKQKARQKAIQRILAEHRANLGGGQNNAKVTALTEQIKKDVAKGRTKHVVFVDSTAQRQAVTEALQQAGYRVWNIAASTASMKAVDIERRKRAWAKAEGPSVLIIDRKTAAGHNLQEGHALHVLGAPDDAAQYLQAQGRLARVSRRPETGDVDVYTYRYEDSPYESLHWRKLEAELKLLRATAPGLFKSRVQGRDPSAIQVRGPGLAGVGVPPEVSQAYAEWLRRWSGKEPEQSAREPHFSHVGNTAVGALWRVSDGWGEWYILQKPNGQAAPVAAKWPDVRAFTAQPPYRGIVTKQDVREHGWGDAAWDRLLMERLVENNKRPWHPDAWHPDPRKDPRTAMLLKRSAASGLRKGRPLGAPWLDDSVLDAVSVYRRLVVEDKLHPIEAFARLVTGVKVPNGETLSFPWLVEKNEMTQWWLLQLMREGLPIPDIDAWGMPAREWIRYIRDGIRQAADDLRRKRPVVVQAGRAWRSEGSSAALVERPRNAKVTR